MDRMWESWLALVAMVGSAIGLTVLVPLLGVPIAMVLAVETVGTKALGWRTSRQARNAVSASVPR